MSFKYFERRYHATWMAAAGYRSPLSQLGHWIYEHRGNRDLALVPRELLAAAQRDVLCRLPSVAARDPTRRHRKHFAWLLGWHDRISEALGKSA